MTIEKQTAQATSKSTHSLQQFTENGSAQTCVRVPPRAAPFSFEKEVVLVGIAMHLPCTLIHASGTEYQCSKLASECVRLGC